MQKTFLVPPNFSVLPESSKGEKNVMSAKQGGNPMLGVFSGTFSDHLARQNFFRRRRIKRAKYSAQPRLQKDATPPPVRQGNTPSRRTSKGSLWHFRKLRRRQRRVKTEQGASLRVRVRPKGSIWLKHARMTRASRTLAEMECTTRTKGEWLFLPRLRPPLQ